MTMNDAEYSQIGSSPVSESNPTGEDIRYDPDFEWLEQEVAKLTKPVLSQAGDGDNPDEGGTRFVYLPVDWPRVVELSESILKNKSKDIRVGVWLTQGQGETRGIVGLADGLTVCAIMLESHWDNLYPPRPQVRLASLKQLAQYLKDRLEGTKAEKALKVTPADIPVLQTALVSVQQLAKTISTNLPDARPIFGLTQSAISRRLAEAEATRQAATPPAQQPSPSVQVGGTTDEAASERAVAGTTPSPQVEAVKEKEYDFAKPADRYRYFSNLHPVARKYHQYCTNSNPADPLPYRWARFVFWTPLEYPPEMTTIPVPRPNEQLVNHLANLSDTRSSRDLLQAAEGQFGDFWYWLDIQYYVVDALSALGGEYEWAMNAVVDELRFLLRRIPSFPTLLVQDDFPVVSEETRAWLDDVQSAGGSSDDNRFKTPGAVGNASSTASSELLSLDTKSSVEKNLEVARDFLRTRRSECDRFLAQLVLAKYLVTKKEVALAYYYLDILDNAIKEHRLELWDPSLASAALVELYNCVQKLSKIRKEEAEPLRERSRKVITRIAQLDPVQAARIGRK